MNWTGESVFRGPLLLGVGVLHILRLSSSSMAADAEDRLQLFPNAGKLSRGEEVQPPPPQRDGIIFSGLRARAREECASTTGGGTSSLTNPGSVPSEGRF